MTWNLRRWAAVGPLLLVLAATPGCPTKPAVSVHHAELRGLSPMGLGMVIFLSVRNDNSYDVQIRNVSVNVTFGRGYPLGPINFSPNQWLPSNQTTMVAVPVSIPWQLIPTLISETLGSYSIPYYVKGHADVTAVHMLGINKDDYPVDEAGSIPRQMVVDAARNTIPLPF